MMLDVIIIGAGCAGLTAAIYCGRARLNTLVFAGDLENKGGLLMKTNIVENYPGFATGIDGYELMQNMEEQALNCGARIINETVLKVDFTGKPFVVHSESGKYFSKTVIICTGSNPNKLGIDNEDKLWTKGISSCAVCDGSLYKNKKIMVIGGGDSALEEALFLTKFSNVTLVHRRNAFRASNIMIDRVISNDKIEIIYDSVVDKIIGSSKLSAVVLRNVLNDNLNTVPVDGLFYGLGSSPNTSIFRNQINMDDIGHIKRYRSVDGTYKTMTSIEGVFVAGDSCDKRYRQAIVACGEGCKSALDVEKYLENYHI